MTKLVWGSPGEVNYEFGVDRGVFYTKNGIGYSWSGLVSVKETTEGADQKLIYIDGVGHEQQISLGDFAASVDAITYPEAFEPYDGYSDIYSGQGRRSFDFSYRTMQAGGHYKIHLVYNALATPSQRNNASLNNTPEIELFSWQFSTRPEMVPGALASSHFVVDTTQVNPGLISALEERLYGNAASNPDMPTVTELLAIFEEHAVFRVTDNGDGTATISGPDWAVHMVDGTTAELTYESVIQLSSDTYQLSSL